MFVLPEVRGRVCPKYSGSRTMGSGVRVSFSFETQIGRRKLLVELWIYVIDNYEPYLGLKIVFACGNKFKE
jgi:hypothetical protein